MPDAQAILAPLQIPDSVKADAWDAYHAANSSDDLAARLQKLPLANNTRADLWDSYAATKPADFSTTTTAKPEEGGFKGFLNSVGEYVKATGRGLNPLSMVKGAADLIRNVATHPIDTTNAMAARNAQNLTEAEDAWKRGDYSAAAVHGFNYLAPFGSAMDDMANDAQQGHMSRALGNATAFGVQMAAPGSPLVRNLVNRIPAIGIPGATNPNPVEAAAADFGKANDIPVSAGVATGNRFIQGTQALVDHSPVGAFVAQHAKAAEGAAFTRVGGELADQVHPNAVAPAQAGRDVTSSIESTISRLNAEAGTHYDTLRDIEADPANVRNVQVGTKQVPRIDAKSGQTIPDAFDAVPDMKDVALPVDLRPVKAALKPVYDQIMRQLPITQQRGSAGVKALENILNGPDAAPVSQVDMDLGTIKAAARGADLPELKTLSQGLAARAVGELHDAVTDAVGRAERTPPGGIAPPAAAPAGAPAVPAAGAVNTVSMPFNAAQARTALDGAERVGDAADRLPLAGTRPDHIFAPFAGAKTDVGTTVDDIWTRAKGVKPTPATVPMDELNALQNSVVPSVVRAKIDALEKGIVGDKALVAKQDGKYFILDGHHDLSAQKFGGAKTADVMLVDLDKPAGAQPEAGAFSQQLVYKGHPELDWRTGDPIKQFDSKNGPWAGIFSDSEDVAKRFANAHDGPKANEWPAAVSSAKVSMDRPFVIDAKGAPANQFMIDALDPKNNNPALRAAIDDPKYDGLVIKNTGNEGTIYIPKAGSQIENISTRRFSRGNYVDAAGAQPEAGAPPTATTSIPIPNSARSYPAEYQVMERGDVQASHNAQTFQPNTKYGLLNERNYNNPVNRGKVIENSSPEQFDPSQLVNNNADAVAGPTVVDAQGNAVAGNGRKMMIDRAYDADPGGAYGYKDKLAERAGQFGSTAEAVHAMKEPMLVRSVPDEAFARPGFSKKDAIRDMNIPGTAALTPAEQALADARRVSQPTLDHVAAALDSKGPDATLAQVLEGRGGVEIINKLRADGVIPQGDMAALTTEDGLTKAGKDRIGQLMVGRFFKDAEQLDNVAPAVRGKMERIAAPLAGIEGEGPFNLTPTVKSAVDLLDAQRAHGSSTLDDYLDQSSLFARERYKPEAIELARQLQSTNPNELTNSVREYAAAAKYAGEYQGPGMFGDIPAPKTPAEAFQKAFGPEIWYHGSSAPAFKSFKGDVAYLADSAGEATAYAHDPILGGGRGQAEPTTYRVAATKGKTRDISQAINDEMAETGDLDIDAVIEREAKKARADGYSYLEFDHPSTDPENASGEFRAKVSLYPARDLKMANAAPSEAAAAEPPASAVPAKPAGFDASFKPTPAPPPAPTAAPLGAKVGTSASQEALDALAAGRKATAEKYDAAGILKSLPKSGEEGRQVFDQAVWAKDAGIEHLRELQRIAPAEIPKLGRAFLDELFGKASGEGGFKGGAGLQAKWQAMGPETKQVLFPNPMLRKDLDNFFLLAKKSAESPNPSGSALVGSIVAGAGYAVTHPVTGIPMLIGSGALSKMLHSPAGVEALSRGLTVNLANKAQATIAAGQILRIAGSAAQPAPRQNVVEFPARQTQLPATGTGR